MVTILGVPEQPFGTRSEGLPDTCPYGRSICYRMEHKDIARKLDRH